MTRSIHVLVVDNDESILRAIAERLASEGIDSTTACSAAQAIGTLRSRPPDLVLSDICMPGLDGIGLAEDIRRISQAPVVLMTGWPEDYRDSFQHLANVRLLSKPFAWSSLRDIVGKLREERP